MAESQIFVALKQDHDKHRDLLARIDAASDADRATLFESFRVEVTAHAASEEMSLYATMLARPELREEAQHSVAEHKEIEDYLTKLYEADVASPDWLECFGAMKKRYLHHIEEEEEEMFPEAEKELSNARKIELAAIFAKRKPEEKDRAAENPPSSEHERE